MPFLLKRLLFRLHWLLGLTAGLVLAVVGVTGALLSYEEELLRALDPPLQLAAEGRERLSPDQLIAHAAAAHPQLDVRSYAAQRDPAAPVELRLGRGAERGGLRLLLDPYRGTVLPEPRGTAFFDTTEQVHRNLASGAVGKQIVGASSVALIVLALSGLVLRWPRRWGSPRAWLRLDLRLRGRNLLWHLHAVAGTWMLACYLLAALTGLWWSYEGYRAFVNGMAGVPLPPVPPTAATAAAVPPASSRAPRASLDRAEAALLAAVPEALRWSAALPSDPAAPVEWRYATAAAPHARAFDTLRVDPRSGEVVARQPYATLPRGRRLVASMLPLHTGAWFGEAGRLAMMLASFAMPLFAVTGAWLWLQRRRRAALAHAAARPEPRPDGAAVEILHASQSGTAERVAHLTAAWLRAIGLAPQVRALAQWQPALAGDLPALFVVASYGEGDPPDAALGFARRWLRAAPPDLSRLQCDVLALGNRRYATFCGFGHALAGWLARGGARGLGPLVESHEAELASLQAWRVRLAERWPALAHAPPDLASTAGTFEPWTMQRRRLLNPDGPGAPLCELWLSPPAGATPSWVPGDLLEFAAPDGVPRPYSIASLPGPEGVRLLVRRVDGAGGPGQVSAPLCDPEAPLGVRAARLRRAAAFDPPPPGAPAILVANGVGIAPFLALLARADRAPRWLLFGERDPRADAALLPELRAALQEGRLARLDLAWSRATPPAYVQRRLREAAAELRDWLARGALLRVCGSPQMGAAVDALLVELHGAASVQDWLATGRYRRELF